MGEKDRARDTEGEGGKEREGLGENCALNQGPHPPCLVPRQQENLPLPTALLEVHEARTPRPRALSECHAPWEGRRHRALLWGRRVPAPLTPSQGPLTQAEQGRGAQPGLPHGQGHSWAELLLPRLGPGAGTPTPPALDQAKGPPKGPWGATQLTPT